ncbi:hypothetical protein [uncultured Corynebacterium sp.]|uniref:hypothetical protein n=1 Tax=uncultured Corynebacterium sp. TaxID=159447 RepID=UPI0025914C66|nr:hypothetical protein [uncultured Corynebacterium sp.]
MAFKFVSASDDRSRFTDDIPVQGETLTFSVPLMPFVAKDKFAEFHKWVVKNPDQKLIDAGKRPIEEAFDYMVTLLDIDDADKFTSGLVYGEKAQLWEEWMRLSDMPLGESTGSATS